jgi:hypothetical protein
MWPRTDAFKPVAVRDFVDRRLLSDFSTWAIDFRLFNPSPKESRSTDQIDTATPAES